MKRRDFPVTWPQVCPQDCCQCLARFFVVLRLWKVVNSVVCLGAFYSTVQQHHRRDDGTETRGTSAWFLGWVTDADCAVQWESAALCKDLTF